MAIVLQFWKLRECQICLLSSFHESTIFHKNLTDVHNVNDGQNFLLANHLQSFLGSLEGVQIEFVAMPGCLPASNALQIVSKIKRSIK